MSSSSTRYTCNSCNLAFAEPEDQRNHMKSDWHRYNLKRRVSQLPPINEITFNSKVSQLSISNSGDDQDIKEVKNNKQITKKEQRRLDKEALLLKKKELLELARKKMINSGGVLRVKSDGIQEEEEEEEEKKDEETNVVVVEKENDDDLTEEQLQEKLMEIKVKNRVEIPVTKCMFCNSDFKTIDENIEHMFKSHGLYIPEPNYLVDKEGLIKYISEKLGFGNVCLSCNYQGKNLQAIQQHILSKSHCRIPYETENEKLEISDFYDFTSTYSKIDGPDDDWEDLSGDEAVQVEDDEPPQEKLYSTGFELHLPDGTVAGHRSLQRYYKQNLKPERELSEGQGTLIAAETRHFVNIIDKDQITEQKRAWGREKKRDDINDRRAAKFINNQPHYRDQLLQ
ncbi:hypothetical protein CANARDRAFT_209515 [[Candida] arabinofermentans NRRL YB-2248]|uniref:C2H2-type domain-containing protein n=1 Tax=[Candida] arabinofermentans NRRL YB-2248 TaxID=983967 RepID=A0A1E4SU45_9ASCO|nr:hypothetical protein CANARDRAFT_209515 [[Candida] arabinofermentans NRRL YB-2248]